MESTIRPADVACALCAVFLFATFAASNGWNAAVLCIAFLAAGGVLFAVLHSRGAGLLIIGCVIALPLSFFYYRVRVVAGVQSEPSVVASPLFSSFYPALDAVLPFREASLLEGMLTGSTAVLAADVKTWMSLSGTSYLLGMYGYKVHLLWEAILGAAARFVPRYAAMTIALFALAMFVVFAGSPLSAARATVMVAIASLAEISGRPFGRRNALMLTAAAMIFIQPSLWQGAGFMLSFMSLAGIYLAAPRFRSMIPGKGRGWLDWKSYLSASIGINAAILPFAAISYGSFPLISFVSNFLLSITFGITIFLGIVCTVCANLLPFSAILIAPPLRLLLSYELFVSRVFSFVSIPIPGTIFTPLVASIYYLALVFWVWRVE